MKRALVCILALTFVASLSTSAFAQDKDETALFDEIVKAAAVRLSAEGKSREELTKELIGHVENILKKCDAYLKVYPKGAHAADVMGQQISMQMRLAQLKRSEEVKAKAVAMAREMIKMHPTAPGAVAAYGVLLEEHMQAKQTKEALEVANKIVELFPEHASAPQALFMVAYLQEEAGNEKEATAALERLAKDYPGTTWGDRAAGKLRFNKLKGTVVDLKFTAVDGTEIDLATYRGKVVLIDFWASWCGPCVGEMPNVVRSYKLMYDKGFRVIGISLDQKKESMEDFMKKAAMTWPQYFDGKGWGNEIARKYGISSIPQTFLIDREGKVREIGLRGGEMQRAIRKLLDEKE